ncbi:MAG: ABC transporter permease subunit [Candidatus Heimdallarchaeota archaeon]|nr:ABC transporter permease subunit [Candidatus Heimdallarchaeota archaeon]MDH5644696.1 ABC transporter permease subunit [Candidatus Heimdallarchaeota archaeon]
MQRFKFKLNFIPVTLFLGIFFYLPLLFLIYQIIISDVSIKLLQHPLIVRFLLFSFTQSILTVILSCLFGVPTGYLLARSKIVGLKFFKALITIPFIFPPLILLLGFVVLFRTEFIIMGFTFSPFSFWGIVIAHVIYNISVVSRISESSFIQESKDYHDLAETLGISKIQRFTTITIPHIKSSLLSAMILVFLYSFNSFAIVLLLGQFRYQTIEVMIFTQSKLQLNTELAALLAILQLSINFTILLLYTKVTTYQLFDTQGEKFKPYISPYKAIPYIIFIILITNFPMFIVIYKALMGLVLDPQISLLSIFNDNYERYLGTTPIRVVKNTVFFGLLTSCIILLFSLSLLLGLSNLTSNRSMKFFDIYLLLPLGSSSIVLSYSYVVAFGSYSAFGEYIWIFILILHVLSAVPFTMKILISSWKRIPINLMIMSETLQASQLQKLRFIIFPMLKSSILIAMVFSFAISIGEFGATYYLVRGEWTTLSVSIGKFFASRNNLLPHIYASILSIFAIISFILIEKLGGMELNV